MDDDTSSFAFVEILCPTALRYASAPFCCCKAASTSSKQKPESKGIEYFEHLNDLDNTTSYLCLCFLLRCGYHSSQAPHCIYDKNGQDKALQHSFNDIGVCDLTFLHIIADAGASSEELADSTERAIEYLERRECSKKEKKKSFV